MRISGSSGCSSFSVAEICCGEKRLSSIALTARRSLGLEASLARLGRSATWHCFSPRETRSRISSRSARLSGLPRELVLLSTDDLHSGRLQQGSCCVDRWKPPTYVVHQSDHAFTGPSPAGTNCPFREPRA